MGMGLLSPLRCHPSPKIIWRDSINDLYTQLAEAESVRDKQEELSESLKGIRPNTFFRLFSWSTQYNIGDRGTSKGFKDMAQEKQEAVARLESQEPVSAHNVVGPPWHKARQLEGQLRHL